MSPPPVHNGTVYFGSFDNNLYAVDVNTGRMKWKFRTGIYGNGVLPVLHNDVIYHASRDGFVYAITLEGKQIWRFSTKHNICVPIVHDEKLFFGSEDRFLYCLSLDGRLLWKKEFESIIFIRPVAKDNVVYFTCWDCNVYALDIDTQKVLWKFRMSGSPSYLPPPYESFEMSMKIDENTVEDGVRKKYDFDLADENDNLSTYKSRITYQVSTQYASKGKYQIDSDEEEF